MDFPRNLPWHTSRLVFPDPTYWLLGLPFDAIGMSEAVQRIRDAAHARTRLIVITPNVNFVSMAASDARFRDTLLASQLSLVDGMPLVWLGRRSGIPFVERVAGSTLLIELGQQSGGTPLRVYFFGGEPGAAERAAARIALFGPGLEPAGHDFPGFGSIESMSSDKHVERINSSGADLLVLALGARKGHQWIERNHARLHVPVITHLGAAVNFVAGTLRRAPAWAQHSGTEWLWRIAQEPGLFGRYWQDGRMFLRLLWRNPGRSSLRFNTAEARAIEAVQSALAAPGPEKTLDVADIGELDPRTLGLLYAWRHRMPGCQQHRLICSSEALAERLRQFRADCLLSEPAGAASARQ